MFEGVDRGAVRAVHVDGWTVVQVPDSLQGAVVPDLIASCRDDLDAGAPVAIDLRGHPVGPDGHDALVALSAEATSVFVVVAADDDSRGALAAAGVVAHASLDAALGNSAPVLRRASDGEPPRHVAPAATDSLLVTTEDIARLPGGADPR